MKATGFGPSMEKSPAGKLVSSRVGAEVAANRDDPSVTASAGSGSGRVSVL